MRMNGGVQMPNCRIKRKVFVHVPDGKTMGFDVLQLKKMIEAINQNWHEGPRLSSPA